MSVRDFALPDLGEGLEEGEIVEWLVAVGDTIELNQPVASIETAKAVVEVPSPFAGTVVELLGAVGETLEVGSTFVRIDTAGGVAPPSDDGATDEAAAAAPKSTGLDADTEPQPLVGYGNRGGGGRRRRRGGAPADADVAVESDQRARAKPPVRKLAKDLGVDLAAIGAGSGPEGTITREDVRAAAATRIVAEQAGRVDLILCETMASAEEGLAAATAAWESGKPVWLSWTLADQGAPRLRSGAP